MAYSIVKIAFTVIGTIENVLVCIAIWRKRKLRTSNNILIANLALNDVLFGPIFFVWINVDFLNSHIAFHFCAPLLVITTVVRYISRILFVCVSIERYFAVRWPFKHKKYATLSNAMYMTGLSVALATFCAGLPFMTQWSYLKDKYNNTCTIRSVLPASYWFYMNTVCLYLVPLIAIIGIYWYLHNHPIRNRKRLTIWEIDQTQKAGTIIENQVLSPYEEGIKRSIKTLALAIACYFGFKLPIHVFHTTMYVTNNNPPWPRSTDAILNGILLFCYYFVLVINPFIYASNKQIRHSLITMIVPMFKRIRPESTISDGTYHQSSPVSDQRTSKKNNSPNTGSSPKVLEKECSVDLADKNEPMDEQRKAMFNKTELENICKNVSFSTSNPKVRNSIFMSTTPPKLSISPSMLTNPPVLPSSGSVKSPEPTKDQRSTFMSTTPPKVSISPSMSIKPQVLQRTGSEKFPEPTRGTNH